MALLEIKGLSKSFSKGRNSLLAVDRVNLTVEAGECVGLVGESGCGKTTLAHMIARLLQEDDGQIYFNSADITKNRQIKQQRKFLQMIFQNPIDSFDPRYTVIECVKQGAKYFGLYGKEQLNKLAKEALLYVGLKETLHQSPIHQLSGGECQRVAIARAIIGNPKLIICDEATSALDVSVQAQILKLLQKLKHEKGMSYLFITHDFAVASNICDRIAVMYKGSIVEIGSTEQIIENPYHPYTKLLLSCILPPTLDEQFEIPHLEAMRDQPISGCKFYEYCPNAFEKCHLAHPELEEKDGRKVACYLYK